LLDKQSDAFALATSRDALKYSDLRNFACLLRIAERSSGEEKSRHYQGDERTSHDRFAGIAFLAMGCDGETVTPQNIDDIPQIRYGILNTAFGV